MHVSSVPRMGRKRDSSTVLEVTLQAKYILIVLKRTDWVRIVWLLLVELHGCSLLRGCFLLFRDVGFLAAGGFKGTVTIV